MRSQIDKRFIRSAAQAALLHLIRARVLEDPQRATEPVQLVRMSLADLVEALLSPDGNNEVVAALRGLRPEDVGTLYEHLRGFELIFDLGGEPRLKRSASGKRNEGLFYTPSVIVKHIVARTLDAIVVEDEIDYLTVKVLDPAVGTGAFLAEALDELTARVLSGKGKAVRSTVRLITKSFERRMEDIGVHAWLDERIAVKAAILENCLYGVDLDPVAVAAARALLTKRAFGTVPVPHDLKVNLRVGNALIGTATGSPDTLSREAEDRAHAGNYLNARHIDAETAAAWARAKLPIHWPLEFPEAFAGRAAFNSASAKMVSETDPNVSFRPSLSDDGLRVPLFRKGGTGGILDSDQNSASMHTGFDAVVGNPPYEILSVKESGIDERHREQSYFRNVFHTCQGKLNTYRLMMERGLELLRDGGALGFIVPATLLADSTAEKLRRELLDETRIVEAVLIPEKARVFDRVTQALVILVVKKGERTELVSSARWDGSGPIPDHGEVAIERSDLDRTSFRIPILRSPSEKKLLDLLNRHPPLRGGGSVAPAGIVHQGEINLTVHREFITSEPTEHPLVRGEHVHPFRLVHPAPRGGRLDWVVDSSLDPVDDPAGRTSWQDSLFGERRTGGRGKPWEQHRIVLGRVVNMATERRLKAAEVPPGTLLGDMTNFVTDLTMPLPYLVGLLNSALLNWRIKITSTNNYLSAAEIEGLPIPRWTLAASTPEVGQLAEKCLDELNSRQGDTITENLKLVRATLRGHGAGSGADLIALMIANLTTRILHDCRASGRGPAVSRQKLLDALVQELYGAGDYAEVIEGA